MHKKGAGKEKLIAHEFTYSIKSCVTTICSNLIYQTKQNKAEN